MQFCVPPLSLDCRQLCPRNFSLTWLLYHGEILPVLISTSVRPHSVYSSCVWLLSFCTVMLSVALVYSFCVPGRVLLYEKTTVYLSILVFVYIWFSILELLTNSIVLNTRTHVYMYTSSVCISSNVCISAEHISCDPAVYSWCEGISFLIPLQKGAVACEGKYRSLVCYMCLPWRSHKRENRSQSYELAASNNNCSLVSPFYVLSVSYTLFHLILIRNLNSYSSCRFIAEDTKT